ncbi:hypothetical protein, partial [Nocardia brasiliensis]|uniref:hypothetical protein n=1 Tax=Nocardia brasiliensis TaxID=37326 RepID=UPI00245668BD
MIPEPPPSTALGAAEALPAPPTVAGAPAAPALERIEPGLEYLFRGQRVADIGVLGLQVFCQQIEYLADGFALVRLG